MLPATADGVPVAMPMNAAASATSYRVIGHWSGSASDTAAAYATVRMHAARTTWLQWSQG